MGVGPWEPSADVVEEGAGGALGVLDIELGGGEGGREGGQEVRLTLPVSNQTSAWPRLTTLDLNASLLLLLPACVEWSVKRPMQSGGSPWRTSRLMASKWRERLDSSWGTRQMRWVSQMPPGGRLTDGAWGRLATSTRVRGGRGGGGV